jgi:hypothetical protein
MNFKERKDVKAEVTFTGGDPMIYIAPIALDKMALYVQGCDKEIGWLGYVTREDNYFIIRDVYLFKQEVNATTCEISPEGLSDFAMDVLTNQGDNGMEIINNLRLWGHSHVNMGVSPSGQDDTQILTFREGNPWFIRVIANKLGEMEFSVYDFEQGIKFKNVKWIEYRSNQVSLEDIIKAEIAEKVTTKVWNNAKSSWNKNEKGEWVKDGEIVAPAKKENKAITYYKGYKSSWEEDNEEESYQQLLASYKSGTYGTIERTTQGILKNTFISENFLKAELIEISKCINALEATDLVYDMDVINNYSDEDVLQIYTYAQNIYPQ